MAIELIIILLAQSCGAYDMMADEFGAHNVYCSPESYLSLAQLRYGAFQQYYNVVYVQPTWYGGNPGQAFYPDNYAISVDNTVVVRHEIEHLTCDCLYTADGIHGSDKTRGIFS